MYDWKGVFVPLDMQKHRLGTGDIENHLEIVSVEEIDRDDAPSDIKELGSGEVAYLVTVGFIDSNEEAYQYVMFSDEEPSEDDVKHEVAHSLETRSNK